RQRGRHPPGYRTLSRLASQSQHVRHGYADRRHPHPRKHRRRRRDLPLQNRCAGLHVDALHAASSQRRLGSRAAVRWPRRHATGRPQRPLRSPQRPAARPPTGETQMTITVLGGGPAGAFTGERVASAGLPVTIIDEKLAWEKPCGGGLTAKALETYPFLAAGDAPKRFIDRAVLVASNGARATLRLRRPIAIYSRQVLNGLLLDRARRAGANVIQD